MYSWIPRLHSRPSQYVHLCITRSIPLLTETGNLGQRGDMIAQRGVKPVEFTTRELTARNSGEDNTETTDYEQIAEGW